MDEGIEDFSLLMSPDGLLTGLALRISATARRTPSEIARAVREVVAEDISRRMNIPQKKIWELPGSGREARDVLFELLDRDDVFHSGPGQMAIGGPLLRVLDRLDATLRALVTERFAAVEYRYPTLLPTSVVERCGYFDSFPHFVMFVTRLHSDIDSYRRFARLKQEGAEVSDYAVGLAAPADHCLPPTMCFHTYHQFAGRRFAPGKGTVITSRGASFRHESRYAHGLERLWDFTIRETVFFGDRTFVRNTRQRLMEEVRELLACLGLQAHLEVANDPFFLGADRGDQLAVQALAETKYELRMPIGDGRTVAVGSFNYADDFFTRRFDLAFADTSTLRSGCMGFGLERLAFAFLCQYGLDEAGWPPQITGTLGPAPLYSSRLGGLA
ncbi:hypothetical protein AB0I22_32420 [Streptomyces sp. NPDC050610]|uniref:hypothetical protein n=1 Tax=Streptomyces sp. NPDC050610 TaxID=3157097 RepID=UPI00343BC20A